MSVQHKDVLGNVAWCGCAVVYPGTANCALGHILWWLQLSQLGVMCSTSADIGRRAVMLMAMYHECGTHAHGPVQVGRQACYSHFLLIL